MKLKYQISFGLKNENHLSKSGEVAIRMRITYNCTRVDLLMGVSVAPELWNKSKQVAKGRGTNRRGYDAVHINAVIAQYRKAADDAMDYFTSNQIIPEPVELRDKIDKLEDLSFASDLSGWL